MLRYVSRDANITQFYGACVTNGDMMLVEELMEVGGGAAPLVGDVMCIGVQLHISEAPLPHVFTQAL